MITYTKLGINGRLGNQMFQYATLVGVARKLNLDIVLDETLPDTLDMVKNFNLKNLHWYNKADINVKHLYKEIKFNFDSRIFNKVEDNTDLEGYFQSWKYFDHVETEIRDQFKFKKEIVDTAKKFITNLNVKGDLIVMHVRRGDYVNLPDFYPLCSVDYYNNAIKEFGKDNTFLFCSDDIEWCKSNFKGDNIFFSTNDTFTDLCIMTLADKLVISNSTFSWWGAYLNETPRQNIIMPMHWFGFNYMHFITDDLYLEGVKLRENLDYSRLNV